MSSDGRKYRVDGLMFWLTPFGDKWIIRKRAIEKRFEGNKSIRKLFFYVGKRFTACLSLNFAKDFLRFDKNSAVTSTTIFRLFVSTPTPHS